jgi:hypothetical protein
MEEINSWIDQILINLLLSEKIDEEWCSKKIANRESALFDSEWIFEFDKIHFEKISVELKEYVDKIRKKVFLDVFRITQSSDLAAFASDDFELIIAAKITGISSRFLDNLAFKYQCGEFPSTVEN